MSARELSRYTIVSKYARHLAQEGRRETWDEAVDRNVDMMVRKYPRLAGTVRGSYEFVRDRRVLPSMRAMQFGGAPMEKHNARGFNCCASYCDRLRFFGECFYLLLCGSGTGFSVQKHHVARLPPFSGARRAGRRLPRKVFGIPDCIEGWADSASVLLSSYFSVPVKGFEEYADCEVTFDDSQVRPEGSPLSCGIGRAPGPAPLMRALELARGLLERLLAAGRVRLRPIDAYDLTMFFADASVAGGVRRSATCAIFSADDLEMAACKTGDWMRTNPQRARSNNSAALLRDRTPWGQFKALFEHARQWGEPGFWWTDDLEIIPNPCFEIGFVPYLAVELTAPGTLGLLASYDGPLVRDALTNNTGFLSGWHFCNLTTLNGKTVRGPEDFLARCRAAAEIGTYQAGFTSFPYLGPVTEAIVKKEALLGVAICGMMHKPRLLLDPEVQRQGAAAVLLRNAEVAKLCGVNPAARATCVKPDGKSSAVLESEPGGIPAHSRRCFRVVQANVNERPYQHFRRTNPAACEPSVWSSDGKSDCIRFCIEQPEGTVCKAGVSAMDMLANIRLTYENWVAAGKRPERCVHPALSHNVSNTVHVRPHEWEAVARELYDGRSYFAGVSLVADSCDRDYAQAPYTAVYTPEEQEVLYGAAPLAEAPGLVEEAWPFRDLWDAADFALGLWPASQVYTAEQLDWLGRLTKFAWRHFQGDVRRATYCLKDHFNWQLWMKLLAEYREVDYSSMVEEEATTTMAAEAACVGGACVMQL